ncbi:hypothetical protein KY309_02925 [Candidatus Woesearchaeota archaeon]|nr:hypothetical protein [Candidatus Woesearchaeota archaeon]
MTIDNIVQKKFDECVQGDVAPLEAASAIQAAIGPISGYRYKTNCLTISNCQNRHSINLRESGRKYMFKVEEFKAALRIVARANGRIQVEDHNGRGCSTRHYARAFWEYAADMEARVMKYAG